MRFANCMLCVIMLIYHPACSVKLSTVSNTQDIICQDTPIYSVPNQSASFIFTKDQKLLTCSSDAIKATSTSGGMYEKFNISKIADGTYSIYNASRKRYVMITDQVASCNSITIQPVSLKSLSQTSYTIGNGNSFLSYGNASAVSVSNTVGAFEKFYYVKLLDSLPIANILPPSILVDPVNSKASFRFVTGMYLNANNIGPKACPTEVKLSVQGFTGNLFNIFYGSVSIRNYISVSTEGSKINSTPQFESQFSRFFIELNQSDQTYHIRPAEYPKLYLGYNEITEFAQIFSEPNKFNTFK